MMGVEEKQKKHVDRNLSDPANSVLIQTAKNRLQNNRTMGSRNLKLLFRVHAAQSAKPGLN
jgi:hypothetical protein